MQQEVVVHSDQGTQYTSGDWRAFLRRSSPRPQHESSWQLLRQRGGGKLFPTAEKGTNQASNLRVTGGGQAGCLRLHRAVLQFEASTREQWKRVPDQV